MILKIYGLIWALGILAVGVFYVTGNLTQVPAIVFGFLSFAALFLGMFSVLAGTIEQQLHAKKH